jgi:hypothetical protein
MERHGTGFVKVWLCVALLTAGWTQPVEPTTAGVAPDGDRTVEARETVNPAAMLAEDMAPGGTRLQVTDLEQLEGVRPGDRLFLIQMQGAAIDTLSDAHRYGEVLELGTAGRHELVDVVDVDGAAQALQVRGQGPGEGLRYGYSAAGRTQVLRVPRYGKLTVTSRGVLTAPAWNGKTGGVVVVIADTVRVDGELTASARGFRGGQASTGTAAVSRRFRMANGTLGGERGEGIGGGREVYDTSGGRYGRGAAANGGGGGNALGAPGGGGANGQLSGKSWSGQGVMDTATAELQAAWRLDPAYSTTAGFADSAGGGRGGYGCSTAVRNPLVVEPEDSQWGCGDRSVVGGLGGRPVLGHVSERLFFGGGGGGGSTETAGGGSGGAGGGLVYVLARIIEGEGRISADGAPGGASVQGDGPGGGGGGGSVVLMATEGIGAVRVSASGGTGGTHNAPAGSDRGVGGGGGGGGGYVALVGSSQALTQVTSGPAGTTTQPVFARMPANGATAGSVGILEQVPGFSADFPLPVPTVDLQVTLGLGAVVRTGLTAAPVYATVSNLGTEPAQDVRVRLSLPEFLTGRPLNEDLTCTQVGADVECDVPRLAPGEATVIELELELPQEPQEALTVSAAVTGSGFDLALANNQAELSMEVEGWVHLSGGGCSAGGSGTLGALGLLVPLLGLWGSRRRQRGRGVLALVSLGALAGCDPLPPPPPPVELRVSVEGQGEVSSEEGGIACGAQCQATLEEGTRLTLIAAPAAGQRFVAWSGRCAGTVPTCDATLLNDVEVSATFEPIPPSCRDGLQNQDETDVDCGGSCGPCEEGLSCQQDADCEGQQCVAGLCSSCRLDQELLINGTAEQGAATADYTQSVFIPGWERTGGMTVVRYGVGGFPAPNTPGPAARGSKLFVGGDAPESEATQGVDLRACATLIDRGLVTYRAAAFLGGYLDQGDHAAVRVRFLDGENQQTGLVTLGPVTSAQRNDQSGLIERARSATVPVGTRRAFVTLTCTRLDFFSNDGYADNLSLELSLSP